MTYVTEQLLLYSIQKYEFLLLKCDGLIKNKNIPNKVLDLLIKKYCKGKICSFHGFFTYNLHYFDLLVILYSFYLYFKIIINIYI